MILYTLLAVHFSLSTAASDNDYVSELILSSTELIMPAELSSIQSTFATSEQTIQIMSTSSPVVTATVTPAASSNCVIGFCLDYSSFGFGMGVMAAAVVVLACCCLTGCLCCFCWRKRSGCCSKIYYFNGMETACL